MDPRARRSPSATLDQALVGRNNSLRLAYFRSDAYKARMSEIHYHPDDLGRFAEIGENRPQLSEKFFEWYSAVFAEGALSGREKALIALAVAHAVQCPYCIESYSTGALEKGADLDQMTEAVHVASAIVGGASLVHGVQMRRHANKVSM